MFHIFNVLIACTLYFCQMQTDYVFTFTLYTVTNTEELIQMLFFGDLGWFLTLLSIYFLVVTCTYWKTTCIDFCFSGLKCHAL